MHKTHYSSAESLAVQCQRVPENIFLTEFHDKSSGFDLGKFHVISTVSRINYVGPPNLIGSCVAPSNLEDQVRTVQERVAHGLCQRLAFC
jgi:hypothetical protein